MGRRTSCSTRDVRMLFHTYVFRAFRPVLRIRGSKSFWVTRILILIREKPGSGSSIHKNTPVISRYIKLSKIQFRQNNFLSLIFSIIVCLDLVRKSHKKLLILLNIKYISTEDPDPVFLGHPEPKKMNRIRKTALDCLRD